MGLSDNIQVPLINGKAYAWGDVTLNMFGATISGVTSIMYKDGQEKTNEYGSGNFPVSRSYGKYEAECEIEIELKEMIEIQDAASRSGAMRIQDIPAFAIDVAYQAAPGIIVNDRINNVEFTDNTRETKTGDGRIVVKCKMICSHIDWDSRATDNNT